MKVIQTKIQDKSITSQDIDEFNNINHTLTKAMLCSEIKLSDDIHNSLWLEELHHQTLHLLYWRLILSQLLTRISHSNRISLILKQLPISYNTFYYNLKDA